MFCRKKIMLYEFPNFLYLLKLIQSDLFISTFFKSINENFCFWVTENHYYFIFVEGMIYLKFHFFNECFWNLRTWNYVNQNFYIWIKKIFFQKAMTFFSLLFSFVLRTRLLFWRQWGNKKTLLFKCFRKSVSMLYMEAIFYFFQHTF